MYAFFEHFRNQTLVLIALLLGSAAHAAPIAISGQPAASVIAGQAYSFTPALTGTYSKYVRYSISNKPKWLYFSQYTGRLSGIPQETQVGTYSNIVITAHTWRGRVALPAFNIAVKSAQVAAPPPSPANAAPVISGVPAISGSVAHLYSFTPAASDSNGDPLVFSIQNKPSWAMFNNATGALSGTPDVAALYSHIVISVSDGKVSTALAPFSIAVSAPVLGSATVRWVIPTLNVDGSPLTNLAGFNVSYGTDPNQLTRTLNLPDAGFNSVEIAELSPGTYYFKVNAYSSAGAESASSQIVWKTIL